MAPFIKLCEELFSAATTEFKNLEFFYFHNCPYEGVWKATQRRWSERHQMWDILHQSGHDYKVIFVGDASMSAYEITHPGDRKSTRLNSSPYCAPRMPSSACKKIHKSNLSQPSIQTSSP